MRLFAKAKSSSGFWQREENSGVHLHTDHKGRKIKIKRYIKSERSQDSATILRIKIKVRQPKLKQKECHATFHNSLRIHPAGKIRS
jgi:hypothetical protein